MSWIFYIFVFLAIGGLWTGTPVSIKVNVQIEEPRHHSNPSPNSMTLTQKTNRKSFLDRQGTPDSEREREPFIMDPWSTSFKDESFCSPKCRDQWEEVPDLVMVKPFEFIPEVSRRDQLYLTLNLIDDLSPSPKTGKDWGSVFNSIWNCFDGKPNCCGNGGEEEDGHACGTMTPPPPPPEGGSIVICRLVGKCGNWTVLTPEFITYQYGPDQETNCQQTPNPLCGRNYCSDTPSETFLPSIIPPSLDEPIPPPPVEEQVIPSSPPSPDEPTICQKPLSVIVCVDASGSINLNSSVDNFATVKNFVAKLSTAYLSLLDSKFGVTTYSNDSEVLIPLQNPEGWTPEEIQTRILNYPYPDNGYTHTETCISAAVSQFSSVEKKGPQVILTVTDGDSTQKDLTANVAKSAKDLGFELFVVRVTVPSTPDNEHSQEELNLLSGGDSTHLMEIVNFMDLMSKVKEVSEGLCKDFGLT